MRVVFAGTPEVAIPFAEALQAGRHDLVAVVTRPDAPQGRSRKPVPSPVAGWAEVHGLPVLKPAHPRDPEFAAQLTALAPDCCPVVAYGALIPPLVLAIPRFGWVNVHFSLLPAWRGAAPVQRAIMAGDTETGISVFDLVSELDAGPVYATHREPLRPDDTAGDVLDRLSRVGAELLTRTLDQIEAGARPVPQRHDGVSYAPKLTPEDVEIDWTRPAAELDRLIRGANPSPLAWTTMGGARFKILLAKPADSTELSPGRLRVERRRVLAGTGAGDLELLTVQPVGRHPMPAADWARGLRQDHPWLGR